VGLRVTQTGKAFDVLAILKNLPVRKDRIAININCNRRNKMIQYFKIKGGLYHEKNKDVYVWKGF